jgi:hypothetical protein
VTRTGLAAFQASRVSRSEVAQSEQHFGERDCCSKRRMKEERILVISRRVKEEDPGDNDGEVSDDDLEIRSLQRRGWVQVASVQNVLAEASAGLTAMPFRCLFGRKPRNKCARCTCIKLCRNEQRHRG